MNTYRYPLEEIKSFFIQKSIISLLISVNIIVFILINIISLFFFLYQINPENNLIVGISRISWWLAVPANLHSLIIKPWTLISYMFLQEKLFHLFFNMLVLYFSGKIFLEYLNERQLLLTYLCGGISGAILFILSYNIFPVFHSSLPYSVALGSSASVLAILITISAYAPNYYINLIFIGKLKLKYIAIIFVLIDVLSIEKENPGGHLAHLGGAIWGFLYVIFFLKGEYLKKIKKSINFNSKKKNLKSVFFNKRPLTDEEYNYLKVKKQKEIDRILDRISKSGYSSLTKEEKELLFKNSNTK